MLEFSETDELFVGDKILHEFGSCSDCGLCCRFFSILPVYEEEINQISYTLGITYERFKQRYIKKIKNSNGQIINSLKTPCCFLDGNNCGIYKHRFLVCRTFPFFMNLTTNKGILSGIYLCPQATQFYEGLLDFYQNYHLRLYEELLKKEKEFSLNKEGMTIQGEASLFIPYLDFLHKS
jgi:Fe-S-cluster containining protein